MRHNLRIKWPYKAGFFRRWRMLTVPLCCQFMILSLALSITVVLLFCISGAARWCYAVYLQLFTRTADIPSRQRLRSSTADSLFVPAVRLSTDRRRAFPDACMYMKRFTFGHPLTSQRLKCTYFVAATPVLPFHRSSPLWFLSSCLLLRPR